MRVPKSRGTSLDKNLDDSLIVLGKDQLGLAKIEVDIGNANN